jgi:FtsH-binding integral membrane protein
MVCSLYTPESVFQAAAATCAATIGLTAYAIKTNSDFTECYQWMMGISFISLGFFWSFFVITLTMTLLNVFFLQSDALTVLIAIGIACIYSIYLIIDTQLIVGGKNSELTMDNYVLGAVLLYIDIIQLFI